MREQVEGVCEHCHTGFGYYLIHSGFNESSYAYCDTCGRTALLSHWTMKKLGVPELPQCLSHEQICSEWEPYLKPCDCGGRFKRGTGPRCPNCKRALSPEMAAGYIERNASGTTKGWRWQHNWCGLYCIVIGNNVIEDNFKEWE